MLIRVCHYASICSMLSCYYSAQNYAGIIRKGLPSMQVRPDPCFSKGLASETKNGMHERSVCHVA